jgi:hypothetical protein
MREKERQSQKPEISFILNTISLSVDISEILKRNVCTPNNFSIAA